MPQLPHCHLWPVFSDTCLCESSEAKIFPVCWDQRLIFWAAILAIILCNMLMYLISIILSCNMWLNWTISDWSSEHMWKWPICCDVTGLPIYMYLLYIVFICTMCSLSWLVYNISLLKFVTTGCLWLPLWPKWCIHWKLKIEEFMILSKFLMFRTKINMKCY